MKIQTLVWREIFERKNQLATSFLAILLGVSVIVAMKNITFYSEKAVAYQLDALGANILVLPKSASLQDYYSADMQNDEFPEEYVEAADEFRPPRPGQPLAEVLHSRRGDRSALHPHRHPAQERVPGQRPPGKARASSRGPEACGVAVDVPGLAAPAKETLVRKRVIQTLATNEVLMGADMAAALKLSEGGTIQLMGQRHSK